MALGRDVHTNNVYSMIIGQFGRAITPSGVTGTTVNGVGSLQFGGGSSTAARDISCIVGTAIFGSTSNGGGQANFWNTSGADQAEYFEWKDNNPSGEKRIGYFVSLDSGKIVKSKTGDRILGVSAKSGPGISGYVGDCAELRWQGKGLKDEFGNPITRLSLKNKTITILERYNVKITTELQEILDRDDENIKTDINNLTLELDFDQVYVKDKLMNTGTDKFEILSVLKETKTHVTSEIRNLINTHTDLTPPINEKICELELTGLPKDFDQNIIKTEINSATFISVSVENPDYDPNVVYIPRSQRPEWSPVSLIGKVYVRDEGRCTIGDYCDTDNEGKAIPGIKYAVLSRSSDNVIRIFVDRSQ